MYISDDGVTGERLPSNETVSDKNFAFDNVIARLREYI